MEVLDKCGDPWAKNTDVRKTEVLVNKVWGLTMDHESLPAKNQGEEASKPHPRSAI